MESQLQRPHDRTHDDDPYSGPAPTNFMVEDEGEHHPEKTSVLKKVKAKAKKIKDTIKNHGHVPEQEHEHEHDQDRDHHHDEENEAEDEEIDEDPQIHGAPMYESAAIGGNPTAVGEDRYGTKSSDQEQGLGQYPGQSGTGLEGPMATTGIVHTPEDKNVVSFPAGSHGTNPSSMDKNAERVPEQGAGIDGLLHDQKEDPNYASNYETKITDPTGQAGEEADVTPLTRSMDNMKVSDDKRVQSGGGHTGSHDQFTPQACPIADEFAPRSLTTSGDEPISKSHDASNKPEEPIADEFAPRSLTTSGDEPISKSYDASNKPEELPQDTLTGKSPDHQSGYIEKITIATSAIANKAISSKNVVASKLGYGGNEGTKSEEIGETKGGAKSGSSPTADYAHKVAATVTEKLAPVYEKVAGAGSTVISKVKGSKSNAGNEERPEGMVRKEGAGEGKVATNKGGSVKEYLSEKLKPGDEDKALSEVISETLQTKKKKEETEKTKEPVGKVTESEKVARQLGSGTENAREGDDAIAAGAESTGKGVVDRIKDAVGLWVTKGSQDHPSEQSPGSLGSKGNSAAGEEVVEERRLQESTN